MFVSKFSLNGQLQINQDIISFRQAVAFQIVTSRSAFVTINTET